jgi:predicted AlkP superfamily phosphohydrolase/phosphomutase
MVSGMMSPDLDSDLVYPEEERDYLKQLAYVIEPEASLESIRDSIGKRIELVKHYLDDDWRLFFVVFREFDVLHHFFWGQDLPFYRLVDDFLGDYLLPKLGGLSAKLAIVSDHGFAPVDRAVNVERLLVELGHDADYQVGGWGALYQKREGAGQMSRERREEIIASLRNYRVDGEPILDVYRNEDLYHGPYADRGPDLLVWPKRELGYTFKMRSEETIAPAAPKNGCHLETGLVVLHGFGLGRKQISADIKDVFPTLMGALGRDAADDVDGKVIN